MTNKLRLIALALLCPTAMAAMADDCDSQRKCVVTVSGGSPGSCGATFDKPTVFVSRAGEHRIVWKLDPGFKFKPGMGDGVFFDGPNYQADDQDEFYSNYATEKDNGDASDPLVKKGWRRYHWKFVNSMGATYHYRIQYHKQGDIHPIVCDPVITNLSTLLGEKGASAAAPAPSKKPR